MGLLYHNRFDILLPKYNVKFLEIENWKFLFCTTQHKVQAKNCNYESNVGSDW